MADNTVLDAATAAGDTVRTKDRAGIKTEVIALDLNPAGSESLMAGVMPVNDNGGSLTVDGTVSISGALDTELTTADLDTGAGTDTRAVTGLVRAESGGGLLVGSANPLPVSGTVTADTELPAAAALADATANPTIPSCAALGLLFNGTTWDRIRGDTTNGLFVQVKSTVSTPVTNAGTFAVQDSEKVVDNAAFTDGTTKVLPAGFIFDEVAGTALTENDTAAGRIDSKRALVGVIEDATTRGRRATVSAGGALLTDSSATTQPVSGTVTANAGTGTMAVDTELAAAAALADATANPTVPSVGAEGMMYNGTTWDRVRGDTTNGIWVNLKASVAQPVTDNAGSLTVDAPVGTPVFATPTPSATGGWSKIKYAAQTTTVQTVKGSAGTFGGYYFYNPNATVAYVQVFDVSGAVTLGTTAPDLIYAIPATSAANLEMVNGVNFANAIKLACTTTATGSTAPTTGLDLSVYYK